MPPFNDRTRGLGDDQSFFYSHSPLPLQWAVWWLNHHVPPCQLYSSLRILIGCLALVFSVSEEPRKLSSSVRRSLRNLRVWSTSSAKDLEGKAYISLEHSTCGIKIVDETYADHSPPEMSAVQLIDYTVICLIVTTATSKHVLGSLLLPVPTSASTSAPASVSVSVSAPASASASASVSVPLSTCAPR